MDICENFTRDVSRWSAKNRLEFGGQSQYIGIWIEDFLKRIFRHFFVAAPVNLVVITASRSPSSMCTSLMF